MKSGADRPAPPDRGTSVEVLTEPRLALVRDHLSQPPTPRPDSSSVRAPSNEPTQSNKLNITSRRHQHRWPLDFQSPFHNSSVRMTTYFDLR